MLTIILENSKIAVWLLNLYNSWELKVTDYIRIKARLGLVADARRAIYFSPVKTISIVAVIVILINIIFSVLLDNDIALMGWIIKGLLLFVGLSGLFCEIDLKNLISSSLFMKWINHNSFFDTEEK